VSADDPRRASDARFRARRVELADGLRALLGPHDAASPVDDADRAATIAVEASAAHREARDHGWAVVGAKWPAEGRGDVVSLLHVVSALLGPRDVWLVVPGREPQAVALGAEVVLDNPLGFASLAGGELTLLDREVPGGLWLAGPAAGAHGVADAWQLEVWGAEPWLSAATRAVRDGRQ
jgi:hypothetical protein